MDFKLDTKVVSATRDGANIKVAIEGVKNGKQEEVRLLYCEHFLDFKQKFQL